MNNLPIRTIILHCAATRPSMDIGLKEITSWHKQRGFTSCGYHFIIRRDGTIETGRQVTQQGAHALNYNRHSIGICLVGGVTEHNVNVPEDNFTPAQYTALNQLLDKLLTEHKGADIIGHNGLSGHTTRGCPSFNWRSYKKFILLAHEATYRPDDWADHTIYDWHKFYADSWQIPATFYDALELIPDRG
ncbi:lysozyme [Halomonas daqingensis]|uniref:Lysozyme n=1 Tax=Billgrantia desiderata TaxID=52021 RepID=A0AAW4YVL4_9GAMM|nr:N-acetylmuramoyl-L-alanine amidase [Halomonas desiderata]MCE8052289.1 lysozyme [Halomonas desiderata]